MKLLLASLYYYSAALVALSQALVTLQTIRNLTGETDGYRGRIEDLGSVNVGVGVGSRGGWVGNRDGEREGEGEGAGQVVLGVEEGIKVRVPMVGAETDRGGGEVDGEEVEDTVAAALRMLCTDILVELEKPLAITPPPSLSSSPTGVDCDEVKTEYHDFLASTVRFLHVVQERQMIWRWGAASAVFDGVGWMQGLWASRSKNSQNRSFIEQQMSMYAETWCFGKSNEVLRRDVEVVEYLNDLLDLFA